MSSPFLALRHSKEGILKVELREKYEVYGIIFSSGKPSLGSRELSAGFLLINLPEVAKLPHRSDVSV